MIKIDKCFWLFALVSTLNIVNKDNNYLKNNKFDNSIRIATFLNLFCRMQSLSHLF